MLYYKIVRQENITPRYYSMIIPHYWPNIVEYKIGQFITKSNSSCGDLSVFEDVYSALYFRSEIINQGLHNLDNFKIFECIIVPSSKEFVFTEFANELGSRTKHLIDMPKGTILATHVMITKEVY